MVGANSYHDAAKPFAMTVQELRYAVHNQVDSEVDWAQRLRGGEGIVDRDECAVRARNRCDNFEIGPMWDLFAGVSTKIIRVRCWIARSTTEAPDVSTYEKSTSYLRIARSNKLYVSP
jgi:hypothetical protein